jgi:hypothetical protein
VITNMNWSRAALTVARTFGARGIVLRAAHEARRRVGMFRSAPRYTPSPIEQTRRPFAVDLAALARTTSAAAAIERADRVVSGMYQAFRWEWRPFPANSAAWLRNARADYAYDRDIAWWRVEHIDSGAGDIKDVWEPARFLWVYDLIRGYALSGDRRYVRAFHERFTMWRSSAPPFQGVHWSCGQEVAIRAIALLYAEANFGALSTAEEVRALNDTLAASGERIFDALDYAVSQRNNHAFSEAAALVALGCHFAESHPESGRWLATGVECLERTVADLFMEDGWYDQHSFTYERVALDALVMASRGLHSLRRTFSAATRERLKAALCLLEQLVDGVTGHVPNYGSNDGSFVHPITLADYRDFRPALVAVAAVFGLPLTETIAVDDEVLAWLGVDPPVRGLPVADGIHSGASGWAVARFGRTRVFLRAGRYRTRPADLDPLHLDVTLDGCDIVVDPGTYAYHGEPIWAGALQGSRFHNGPVVNEEEHGVRGPRFLWLAWPNARIVSATMLEPCTAELIAEIPGRARRTIRITSHRVIVHDEAVSTTAGSLRVRWLLAPGVDPSAIVTNPGGVYGSATHDDPAGWFSPRYGQRLPTRYVDTLVAPPAVLAITTQIAHGADDSLGQLADS